MRMSKDTHSTEFYTPNADDIARLKPEHRRRFKRAISTLNALLVDVQEDFPDAEYYLEDAGNFMLMSGETHTGRDCQPRRDRVLLDEKLRRSGGGGW
jgi:hypothetical protein